MLINRPKPINDESLASYLYRLAGANHFLSACSFIDSFTAISKADNNEFTEDQINMVSIRSGYDARNIRVMVPHAYKKAWGEDIYEKYVVKNCVKYCPCCIKDCLHHKLIWCFHPIAICSQHRKMLVDRCEVCGSKITMSRFMSGLCGCGFVYKQSKGIEVETLPWIDRSQNELSKKVIGGCNIQSILEKYSLYEHMNLAEHCFHVLNGMYSFIGSRSLKLSAFHNKKNCSQDNQMYAYLYGNIYWMFDDFPNNFYKVLDKFLDLRRQPQLFYEKKDSFEKLFSNTKYEIIQKAYETYWLGKYNSGAVRLDFSVFKNKKSLQEHRSFLTKDEIKMTWGFSYPTIDSFVNKGLVKMTKVTKGKYKRHMINKKNFDAFLKKQNNMITHNEAAVLLGIQRDSVPKLIKAGILAIKESPIGQEKIDIADIKKLKADCSGRRGHGDIIQFHEALIKYSVNGLTIVKLIEFIKQKTLVSYCSKRDFKLSDLAFKECDLKRCMKLLRKEQESIRGYYFNDVFKILKMGEKTLWRFVRHGIITPDEIDVWKDGRKRYFFRKEKVDQFASAHISISEATRKFGVSRKKIKNWYNEGYLLDYSKGMSKNYLFRMDELQILLNKKYI